MRLLIIRHGESEADILNVHEGRADFELTEVGQQQVILLSEWVNNHYKLDKIYSSTLKRATQTALLLGNKQQIEIEFDEDLMEWNNGLIAGLSREEAEERYPLVIDLAPHDAVYEQESILDFRYRAEKILSKIISENPDDATIAIVSHGGMINKLYQSFLKLPFDTNVIFHCGDTSLHEWTIKDNQRHIVFSNRLEHLNNLKYNG
ncbi:histidine phosphatase family protein [Viridibacillus sp. FSL R5-0477]|uniref:Phosphoglycerate mutase n=1 Tax=Viridibacillus arenosi FSL R5-213 TaxID=1227360 RepID=W4F176_9BACL|nr:MULTISPECIES: histidine phosphatase family protein [Viridibacillus]ETT86219.1 phosphoglycerate mutase [Viridibacillus arenosi FSL R5-213]OMC84876.1 histidine phosphatase family protein [Viridibacillus sp. FSL H8-0123]OMC85780.1 histidine phosphatase family protein [Viridibacillus sp. FSL H7-0596]OMC91925.1 histidine phosphatase family protein [Viridibacillus arenosi]